MPDPNYTRSGGHQRSTGMLSKDVRDILEGIHFFLTEALKDEQLSGKVECMRGGLVMQLEALRQAYPVLHFTNGGGTLISPHPQNLAPPPYSEQTNNGVVGSSRLSTCSGSTSNYSTSYSNSSSTGYSEGPIGLLETREEDESESEEEEIYEEFEGTNLNRASPATKPKSKGKSNLSRSDSRSSQNKLEESYLDNVEPVSFSVLIAKCDHHGTLTKRSKGFLRNSRFQVVLANGLLYLYHKESDDQQKKVIDLSGYSVRNSSLEDGRNSKKKHFAFDLFGKVKKTHMFHCSSERERDKWTTALSQSIICSKQQLQQTAQNALRDSLQRAPRIPLPGLVLTTAAAEHKSTGAAAAAPVYYEFYEELNSEEDPQDTNQKEALHDTISDYQVPDDESQNSGPAFASPAHATKGVKAAPARPPLPDILRKLSRPLPEAPEESYDRPEEDLGIYCEIDDDSFESLMGSTEDGEANPIAESVNNPLLSSRSLSQEIFDTINEKVPHLPERSKYEDSPQKCATDDIDELNYDVPLENTPVVKVQKLTKPNEPPPIPAKGTPAQAEEDDSEYKVPSSVIPQSIYQVPQSSPVAIADAASASVQSRGDSMSSSKQVNREIFVMQSEKKDTEEGKISAQVECFPTSNSVKDLVAMLNKSEIERNSLNVSVSNLRPLSKIKISRDSFLLQQLEETKDEPEFKEIEPLSPPKERNQSKVDKIKAMVSRSKNAIGDSDIYVAKFAYIAPSEGYLSFNRGDEIVITDAPANYSLWSGIAKGKKGLLPKEYIRRKD